MAPTEPPFDLERELAFLETAETPADICEYLAKQVRRTRRVSKLSQAALAERAGVPLRTYKRFEAQGQGNLETFVRALYALERSRYLFMLFPHDAPPRKKLAPRRPPEAPL